MADKPIRVGSMLLTLVEPHPGHAAAYNRWYEEDHVYAILLGPGALAAGRFVARAADRARRVTDGGPDEGSLLAVYWLTGDGSEHGAWRPGNAERLAREGRFYRERNLVYAYTGGIAFTAARAGWPVPIELALDHRYPHAVLSVIRAETGVTAAAVVDAYRDGVVPGVTGSGSPVAQLAGFVSHRPEDPRAAAGGSAPPAERSGDLVVFWFCDRDPAPAWDTLVKRQAAPLAGGGVGRVLWTSAFTATVVGTDTYMDELSR